MRNGEVIERPVDHRTLTKRYTEEARAVHRREQGAAVLPVLRALAAAHSARPIGRVRRTTAAAASTATSSRRSTGAPGSILDALRRGRRRPADARRVHERQRSVAAVRDARRIRRSAARRQRHDVGRRRAHAGDLLVAGHGAAGDRSRTSDRRMDLFADRGGARRARGRRPIASSTASICRAPLTRLRRRARGSTLFYYWDNELRAVRKGAYKAHFITSGAYGQGGARTRAHAAAAVRSRRGSRRALRHRRGASRHRRGSGQGGRRASAARSCRPSRCSTSCCPRAQAVTHGR